MDEVWFRIVVGDPFVDPEPFREVLERFRSCYPNDSDARIRTALETTGLHCEAVVYLSAEAHRLAAELCTDSTGAATERGPTCQEP